MCLLRFKPCETCGAAVTEKRLYQVRSRLVFLIRFTVLRWKTPFVYVCLFFCSRSLVPRTISADYPFPRKSAVIPLSSCITWEEFSFLGVNTKMRRALEVKSARAPPFNSSTYCSCQFYFVDEETRAPVSSSKTAGTSSANTKKNRR